MSQKNRDRGRKGFSRFPYVALPCVSEYCNQPAQADEIGICHQGGGNNPKTVQGLFRI